MGGETGPSCQKAKQSVVSKYNAKGKGALVIHYHVTQGDHYVILPGLDLRDPPTLGKKCISICKVKGDHYKRISRKLVYNIYEKEKAIPHHTQIKSQSVPHRFTGPQT